MALNPERWTTRSQEALQTAESLARTRSHQTITEEHLLLALLDQHGGTIEAVLQEVADITGGKYFRATDTESLRSIYKEIDILEKSWRSWRQNSVKLNVLRKNWKQIVTYMRNTMAAVGHPG